MKKKYLKASVIIIAVMALLIAGDACILRRITGIPCPSCGMTRAYLALFHGDIHAAFTYHPLFPLVPIACVLLCLKRTRTSRFLLISVIAVLCAVYIARMVLYFPETAPMDYNTDSYVARAYFFIKKLLNL